MDRLQAWLRVRGRGSRLAARFVAVFVTVSAMWVLCSDSYIERLNLSPVRTLEAQTLKAILYVLLVAALIYWLTYEGVRRLERSSEREQDAVLDMARRLARAADLRDGGKESHSERLALCAGILARAYGLSEREAENIRESAMLHDIGKIGVRDVLLQKAGPLSADERREIERHVIIGTQLLRDAEHPMLRLSRLIIETHHEAWDGTGYPHRLKGDEIPIAGRIVALCDVFDALVSERSYKQPWPFHEAVEEIRSLRGTRFDPKVVTAFETALPEFRTVYEHRSSLDSNSVRTAHAALN